ncbi:DUF397 domain-containing protein [Glycomyces amatae]|uniref:DUF397 domain-containing protein n=1 Tax=Glycomyces amatae TaxID=2881355 RepID=UPI0034E3030B
MVRRTGKNRSGSPCSIDFGDGRSWRKASRSGGNGGACVAITACAACVGVRDTKSGSSGPVLWFSRRDWAQFIRLVCKAA